jgi:PhoPQ-activated pathogenicity-related protein
METLAPRFLHLLSFVGLFLCLPASAAKLTALDRYIAKPDTNYNYLLVNTVRGDGQTTFVLEMNSQAWLTTNEVNQPVWKHWLTIVKPDAVTSSTALLVISGGSLDRPAPKTTDGNLLRLALNTKSIVAELRGVPNQPLVFAGETKGRTEDALIAYTWDKFLRTGDEKWPARLPMTKSAVRALDTVTAFCASGDGGKTKVDSFVVAGASKRGWTTWTTAAVDKRVIAVIPIVIDMLNLEPSFKHHFEAYGFWAPAVKDYTGMKLMNWMGTKEHRALMEIEEPYEYRDRLTMPKFMIYAAGDQFFLPDSSQFYFDDLPGVKYLRYIPNADHSLKNSDAPDTLEACYRAVLTGTKLPKFSWTFAADGSIRVTAKDTPSEVKLWYATNATARDFRLESIGPVWTNSPITISPDGNCIGKVETPTNGWSAFFVELTYATGKKTPPFKFTTSVRVLPDTLPFKFEPGPKPE